MKVKHLLIIVITFFFFSAEGVTAQSNSSEGTSRIEQLISEQKVTEAKSELETQVEILRKQKAFDSLVNYIKFYGSPTLNENDMQLALKNAEQFTASLVELEDDFITKESYIELSWIYLDAGNPKRSYEIIEEAQAVARRISDPEKADLATLSYKLGYFASALGDYPLSRRKYLNALKLLNQQQSNDQEFYQQVYNALGGVMWFSSKLDSARYYFNKSLEALEKTDKSDLMNTYYRPALVNLNISVISNGLGQNESAINSGRAAVKGFQEFISKSNDEQRVRQAKRTMLMTIDNLGAYYNAIGGFERAKQLIDYSYQQKQKIYEEGDSNLVISLIILAQANMSLRDFEEAGRRLDLALEYIKDNPSVQLYWKAAAYVNRAKAFQELGDYFSARKYFDEGRALYLNSLKGEYTSDYMEDLIVMSQFFVEDGKAEKAINLARETYEFTKTGDFANTLIAFNHKVNLADIHFKAGNYLEAFQYSNEALGMQIESESNRLADSVAMQFRKPNAILINAKSKKELSEGTGSNELDQLMDQIDEAIAILDQRKSVISSYEDLSALLASNDELFNFAKELRLKKFQETGNKDFLQAAIRLHESALYNRIRSRLNLRNNFQFRGVPDSVIKLEQNLRGDLQKALSAGGNSEMDTFFKANTSWNTFVKSLKTDYPNYYQMRFGSIEESLNSAIDNLPEDTTLIRYFFVDDALYAMVFADGDFNLVSLEYESISADISALQSENFNVEQLSDKLFGIHQALWHPLEKHINKERVIIIPDGELYNLSFETLTFEPVADFSEMSSKSLLAKYDISYRFSMLLNSQSGDRMFDKKMVGFAPEFTAEMKDDYTMAVQDSTEMDASYLTLLPQPFSVALINKYKKTFNADSFLNEKASKDIFGEQAGDYKIIHIGTHAESNNVSPELSRLIFAKNTSDPENLNDNSLYTFEIYNYDLSSELAILTACETGKPGYQAGEGMISLSHAFTYAGSESILTSLWKIDEKSSMEILDLFLENLKTGLPKDKALRKAKLKYLETAEGRAVAPQYWAGLVLIGNRDAVELDSSLEWYYWMIPLLLLGLLYLFLSRRRSP